MRGQPASFYWGQFASSLVAPGLSRDKTWTFSLKRKPAVRAYGLPLNVGVKTMLRLCNPNGLKRVKPQR